MLFNIDRVHAMMMPKCIRLWNIVLTNTDTLEHDAALVFAQGVTHGVSIERKRCQDIIKALCSEAKSRQICNAMEK